MTWGLSWGKEAIEIIIKVSAVAKTRDDYLPVCIRESCIWGHKNVSRRKYNGNS